MRAADMNIIKYIVSLTPRKQFTAALLIAISVMGSIIVYDRQELNRKDETCEKDKVELRKEINTLLKEQDSVKFQIQEKANKEIHDYLVKANDELKQQLELINEMNNKRAEVYNQNKRIVNTNKKILKQLKDVQQ